MHTYAGCTLPLHCSNLALSFPFCCGFCGETFFLFTLCPHALPNLC